jgi:hypothetical protein
MSPPSPRRQPEEGPRRRHVRRGVVLDRASVRLSHNQRSVRLRKQKQEERLAARRQIGSYNDDPPRHPDNVNGDDGTTRVTSAWNRNREATTLTAAVAAAAAAAASTANDNNSIAATDAATATSVTQCLQTLSGAQPLEQALPAASTLIANGARPAGLSVLRLFVEEHSPQAKIVVEKMLASLSVVQTLADPHATQAQGTAFRILAILTSPEASPEPDETTSYYGTPPPRWDDFLIPHVDHILQLWRTRYMDDPSWSAWISALMARNVAPWTSGIVRNDNWPPMVHALPRTLPACAAMTYYDTSQYGMWFLQHLLPQHVAELLKMDTALDATQRTEVAWMLEGLARREGRAVEALLEPTAGLLPAVLKWLVGPPLPPISTTTATVPRPPPAAPPSVQLPLWRMLGHCAVASDGALVHHLLSQEEVIQAGVTLLQQSTTTFSKTVLVEGLETLSCLLFDAGTIHHPSTTIAAPAWLPHLAHLLPTTAHEVQLHAWQAMAVALRPPVGHENAHSESMLQQLIVSTNTVPQGGLRTLLQALLDAMRRPDTDLQRATLDVLQMLLRRTPSTHGVWIEIDRGDQVLHGLSLNGVGSVAELAADIVDEFFDQDDDDDSDFDGATMNSNRHQSEFSFGVPAFGAAVTAVDTAPPAGQGRGRGRGTPAWMSQQAATATGRSTNSSNTSQQSTSETAWDWWQRTRRINDPASAARAFARYPGWPFWRKWAHSRIQTSIPLVELSCPGDRAATSTATTSVMVPLVVSMAAQFVVDTRPSLFDSTIPSPSSAPSSPAILPQVVLFDAKWEISPAQLEQQVRSMLLADYDRRAMASASNKTRSSGNDATAPITQMTNDSAQLEADCASCIARLQLAHADEDNDHGWLPLVVTSLQAVTKVHPTVVLWHGWQRHNKMDTERALLQVLSNSIAPLQQNHLFMFVYTTMAASSTTASRDWQDRVTHRVRLKPPSSSSSSEAWVAWTHGGNDGGGTTNHHPDGGIRFWVTPAGMRGG